MNITNISVYNFENAFRGMRNPLNSWDRSDSEYDYNLKKFRIGKKDLELAQKLIKAGSEHAKFLRSIFVSMDIKAPIFFFQEFDTYKIATSANSTSTMHTLMKKELTMEDFEIEYTPIEFKWWLEHNINYFNDIIDKYKETKNEDFFIELKSMLPASFLQTRTWTANYAVLRNIYHQRKNHRLVQWRIFCNTIEEELPCAKELICI